MENGLFSDEVTADLRLRAEPYTWPRFGHNAEVRSLREHLKLFLEVEDAPMRYDVEALVGNRLRETFAEARRKVPSDFMSRTHFERAFASVDMSSSPGLPYLLTATSNRNLFCDSKGVVLEVKKEWAWDLVCQRLADRSSDPIRLFVKSEPIKKTKCEQGRYRLISSISVIDQLVDQMIFGWQNETLMSLYHKTPPKVGWSPLVGGYKLVHEKMNVAIDKKAWDWTVKPWMIEAELSLRFWLADNSPAFIELAKWRYDCLYKNALLVLSSGVVLKQNVVGIMKSGSVNTIMTNSIMQVLLHYRVCCELYMTPGVLWSMGDDTLQTEPEDLNLYYNHLLKYCLAKEPVREVEFAGFRFSTDGVEPMYPAKHAYNLLHFDVRFRDDMRLSYSLLYARSPTGGWVRKAVSELGQLPEPSFLRLIWSGDD